MAVLISSNCRSTPANCWSISSNRRLTSRNPARISSRSTSNLESILEPSLEHACQPSVIMATTTPAEVTSDGIHCTPSDYHAVSGAARKRGPGRLPRGWYYATQSEPARAVLRGGHFAEARPWLDAATAVVKDTRNRACRAGAGKPPDQRSSSLCLRKLVLATTAASEYRCAA